MGTPFLQEPGCGALVEIHPCFSGGYGGLHTLDSDRWLWHTAPCFPVDDAYGHFYSWGSLLFTGKIAPPALLSKAHTPGRSGTRLARARDGRRLRRPKLGSRGH